MSDAEGFGEIVTGAALARAVEPHAGEGKGGQVRDDACLNCGTRLIGSHCHECGQPAHVHRTIHAWWHDFLHSVLHLEGKMWRTLPLLALRPGELTRRFIDGERARFVSPLALFLFSVFVMFAVISFSGGSLIGAEGEATGAAIERELHTARERVETIQAERDVAVRRGANVAEIDRRLAKARRERDGLARAQNLRQSQIETGWPRLDHGIKKATENPSLFFYKLQSSAYKFSWAVIPISVPFLWLLFLHRRRYRERFKAYDHMVFVTYSIAFMSLGLVALILMSRIGINSAIIALLSLFVPPVHIYRQLRGAYEIGRLSALWRTAVLIFLAGFAMLVFSLLLLALGVLS